MYGISIYAYRFNEISIIFLLLPDNQKFWKHILMSVALAEAAVTLFT